MGNKTSHLSLTKIYNHFKLLIKSDKRFSSEILDGNKNMIAFIATSTWGIEKENVNIKYDDKYNMPSNTLMYFEIDLPTETMSISKFGKIKNGAHRYVNLQHLKTEEDIANDCYAYLKKQFGYANKTINKF